MASAPKGVREATNVRGGVTGDRSSRNADGRAGSARRPPQRCLPADLGIAWAGGPVGRFAGAQVDTPGAGNLKQLSIEDLMNLEVTSVAKEPQRLLQARPPFR